MGEEATIETFATLRARLDAEEPTAAVIASHDLDHEAWSEIQETWLGRLAEALDRGDLEVLKAYDEAYRTAYAERTGVELSPITLPEPHGEPTESAAEEARSRIDTTTAGRWAGASSTFRGGGARGSSTHR
jgi:hypothetical protein